MSILTDLPVILGDLYISPGTTYTHTIAVKNALGNVIDLTSYTAECMLLRYLHTDRDYGLHATIPNPTDGQVVLSMSENETMELNNPKYWYSIKLRSNTEVVEIATGYVLTKETVYKNRNKTLPEYGVNVNTGLGNVSPVIS